MPNVNETNRFEDNILDAKRALLDSNTKTYALRSDAWTVVPVVEEDQSLLSHTNVFMLEATKDFTTKDGTVVKKGEMSGKVVYNDKALTDPNDAMPFFEDIQANDRALGARTWIDKDSTFVYTPIEHTNPTIGGLVMHNSHLSVDGGDTVRNAAMYNTEISHHDSDTSMQYAIENSVISDSNLRLDYATGAIQSSVVHDVSDNDALSDKPGTLTLKNAELEHSKFQMATYRPRETTIDNATVSGVNFADKNVIQNSTIVAPFEVNAYTGRTTAFGYGRGISIDNSHINASGPISMVKLDLYDIDYETVEGGATVLEGLRSGENIEIAGLTPKEFSNKTGLSAKMKNFPEIVTVEEIVENTPSIDVSEFATEYKSEPETKETPEMDDGLDI